MNMIDDIAEFHEKFELAYSGPPRKLPADLGAFRIKFLEEELNEYCDALTRVQELDALVDLVYVALGTAYLHGYNFEEAWRRVHGANMKKVRATHADQSTRDSTHDVVKPLGWQPPILSDLV
jgi:predicted HAD superfamily Cof-like phosphohydrolase